MEPRGNVGWAAVSAYMSYVSPFAVLRPSKSWPYQLVVHSQTANGFGWALALVLWEELFSAALRWRGLLGFPMAVGFADGVNASRPNPKNTDSSTTKILVLIVS